MNIYYLMIWFLGKRQFDARAVQNWFYLKYKKWLWGIQAFVSYQIIFNGLTKDGELEKVFVLLGKCEDKKFNRFLCNLYRKMAFIG